MRAIFILCVLLLSACSSAPQKTYYQLPSSTLDVSPSPSTQHRLWIQRIHLNELLSSASITYQTTDVSFHHAHAHQWASPLEQQLSYALHAELSNALPKVAISLSPLSTDSTLEITVTAFHGRYDGTAVIQGIWTLTTGDTLRRQSFSVQQAQQGDGYPALVRALAQGWQQVARDLAQELSAIYP